MPLQKLLSKSRKKILRFLLGENSQLIIDRINKLGSWYLIQKYASKEKYPELLCDWYHEATGHILDLEHPRTYNEKIQWLKLYDTTPLKTQLSDRYLVREWIAEKTGRDYLIPLVVGGGGGYDSFDEIYFDALPGQFVLKATHACGWNVIVKDKSKFNKIAAKEKFDLWMNSNFAYCVGLELQYRDIKPRIIAEQYLEDETGGLADYKFYCFEGKPYCVEYFVNRFGKGGYKAIMYDLEWKPTGWTVDAHHEPGVVTKKPDNFDEMLKIVNTLCTGFHHVRIDLYWVNGHIYFGEMTFTSASGLEHFEPEEWNIKLGNMIKLPID
jgi:hypothetical protein